MKINRIAFSTICLILLYGITISFFSISGFPSLMKSERVMPYLYDKPVGEDGFYMLMVAWNMASGNGIVGNFNQPITGIQPLATFVYSAIAKVIILFNGGKEAFVRGIIIFGVTRNMKMTQ